MILYSDYSTKFRASEEKRWRHNVTRLCRNMAIKQKEKAAEALTSDKYDDVLPPDVLKHVMKILYRGYNRQRDEVSPKAWKIALELAEEQLDKKIIPDCIIDEDEDGNQIIEWGLVDYYKKPIIQQLQEELKWESLSFKHYSDSWFACKNPLSFLCQNHYSVRNSRPDLRRSRERKCSRRSRSSFVAASSHAGSDSGGDDGGGSDDGDGQSDSYHVGTGHEARVNVVVDSQQNKSTEEPGIAARSDALAVAGFFVPFERAEVAA